MIKFINMCLVPKLNELEEETEYALQVMCSKRQVEGTDPFPQTTGCSTAQCAAGTQCCHTMLLVHVQPTINKVVQSRSVTWYGPVHRFGPSCVKDFAFVFAEFCEVPAGPYL